MTDFFLLQAEEFCIYYGLSVTDGCVNFQRSSFIEPETRFPMKRALKLIESKRNCSIGEVSLVLYQLKNLFFFFKSCGWV